MPPACKSTQVRRERLGWLRALWLLIAGHPEWLVTPESGPSFCFPRLAWETQHEAEAMADIGMEQLGLSPLPYRIESTRVRWNPRPPRLFTPYPPSSS